MNRPSTSSSARDLGAGHALRAALVVVLAACGAPPDIATAMAGHAATSNRTYHSDGQLDIADYRDCNHNAFDGRETDVNISQAHCGACDTPCGGHCERGTCMDRADAGLPDGSLAPSATQR